MVKNCFIICPIGNEGSEIRFRSDKIYDELLYPILSKFDYFPIRSDQIHRPGIIHNQIIDAIIESPLVIADLTGYNPNVFYELSIKHAVAKPIIQIIDKNERIPFDIGNVRTLPINIDDLKTNTRNFENMILETEKPDTPWENPISVALITRNIRLNSVFNESDISIVFSGYDSSEITLTDINLQNLPSEREKTRLIKRIETLKGELEKKSKETNKLPKEIRCIQDLCEHFEYGLYSPISPFGLLEKDISESSSIEALESRLDSVKKDFKKDDMYEILEKRSHKINFEITNSSNGHLEDVDIFFQFHKVEGFNVLSKIPENPRKLITDINIYNPLNPSYPHVEEHDSILMVKQHFINIKHFQPTRLFGLDLRVIISHKILAETIPIICEIYAKNLSKPITKNLVIKIMKEKSDLE